MRRGLMAWDQHEVPVEALQARVRRLQSAMVAAGQDAIIIYTNFIRSGAVSYLTAFSPYWADGLLLVPREGEPIFATTLSRRVSSWIQSVKPIGDLVNSPTPGSAVAARLSQARRVAVLELDDFPAGLYGEIADALSNVEIVDGSPTFALARAGVDATERRLLMRADDIARSALTSLNADTATDARHVVGHVEKEARLRGAEEAYVAIAHDLEADRRFVRASAGKPLGRCFSIRATIAYKGSWVRVTRTFARDERSRQAIARADAWLADLDRFDVRRPIQDVPLPANAVLASWAAEAPVGTHPLATVASSSFPDPLHPDVQPVVLTAALSIDGVPWCGARLLDLREHTG